MCHDPERLKSSCHGFRPILEVVVSSALWAALNLVFLQTRTPIFRLSATSSLEQLQLSSFLSTNNFLRQFRRILFLLFLLWFSTLVRLHHFWINLTLNHILLSTLPFFSSRLLDLPDLKACPMWWVSPSRPASEFKWPMKAHVGDCRSFCIMICLQLGLPAELNRRAMATMSRALILFTRW